MFLKAAPLEHKQKNWSRRQTGKNVVVKDQGHFGCEPFTALNILEFRACHELRPYLYQIIFALTIYSAYQVHPSFERSVTVHLSLLPFVVGTILLVYPFPLCPVFLKENYTNKDKI